jgi:hypothetical protein
LLTVHCWREEIYTQQQKKNSNSLCKVIFQFKKIFGSKKKNQLSRKTTKIPFTMKTDVMSVHQYAALAGKQDVLREVVMKYIDHFYPK